ncbi:MAG: hypothetical protein VKS61_00855 [Candidatus Sericytochromatia bacterium]|nr:hypothetical protein [Candidatus Sericytochromatia bacterium]
MSSTVAQAGAPAPRVAQATSAKQPEGFATDKWVPQVRELRANGFGVRVGSFTFNSDGSTSTHLGNTIIRSDGRTSSQFGSTIIHSDGSTSSQYGNVVID